MNLLAIQAIQKYGGIVILTPLLADDMITIGHAFSNQNKVIDTNLQEASGLPCLVIIGKREGDDARKELGL